MSDDIETILPDDTQAPERIYLCFCEEVADGRGTILDDLMSGEVTWAADPAGDYTVEYFRYDTVKAQADRIAALEAEVERLRGALEIISYIHDGNPSDAMAGMPEVEYARRMLGEARKAARAALAEKGEG